MTHLFHQIIPRLTRTPARADEERSGTATAQPAAPEFTVKPACTIRELAEAWGVTVHLPGVAKDGLDLTVEDDVIRIVGRRAWRAPEGWTPLYRESADAAFALTLEHGHSVDVDKIHAELRDGVLRLSLPKAEALKPRKITVA